LRRFAKVGAAILLLAAAGAAGLWGTEFLLARTATESESPAREPQATRVTVAAPERREVSDSVSAVGTIHPTRAIELRPLAAGRVTEVFVDSGARVEEGQPILALDARAARAAVAQAEATRDAARQELRRVRELSAENVAAQARLDEAQAAAARAEAELEAARAALEDRRLKAPFAGTLGIVAVDRGGYVDPTTRIAALDDLSAVEVSFALPEARYARISPGQTVRLHSAVYPDRVFTGEIVVRAASVDPATRSFEVRARLDNPGRRLVGGMFAEVEVVLGSGRALTIPEEAVVSEGAATYVFTVEDGTARRTEIETGSSLGPRTEVTRGLREGARVVVTGWDSLSDGAAVSVAAAPTDGVAN
jgi:membrane fusion protein (multidrug efflux system)